MTELEKYFQFRCLKGLKKRELSHLSEYQERLKYEMDMIQQMGFPDYFLIVSEIITWALSQGIPVGPGRGSAAGSLVAYCLEITHLDPIKYGLIFERFLNPERISMPDIDLDFCEERRDQVINYVRRKFGKDCVAQIGTYGSMKARGAIRDVTRTLDQPYAMGDKLAKLVLPDVSGKAQGLAFCYPKVKDLSQFRNNGQTEQSVLEKAEWFENRLRSFGTHASGYVISKDPISSRIPTTVNKEGETTTQFEMNNTEEVGLIKFDFLGLRALTTIDRCVQMVKTNHGVEINPLTIPVDKEEVYAQLAAGDTDGIFQLEGSSGIQDLAIKLKPRNLEDLSMLVALYRPGPLGSGMVDHIIAVRNGEAETEYLVPELEPILGESAGVVVYQEQIIEICKQLAGFSMGEADIMRKAVGKKKEKLMAEQRSKFISGMTTNGFAQSVAEKLFDDIEAFAAYGFNKAHSACYAFIGYQMAYLKYHYPLEFLCSCLTSDSDENDKVVKYIDSCRQRNIGILPPDINKSHPDFTVEEDNIRFGLTPIKNMGADVAYEIDGERLESGPYKDIVDFAMRINLAKVNRKKLESLVLAGVFDSCSYRNRAALLEAIENIYLYKKAKNSYERKTITFQKKTRDCDSRLREIEDGAKKKPLKRPVEPIEPSLPKIPWGAPAISKPEQLGIERDLLGFYVSGHPLDNVRVSPVCTDIEQLKEAAQERKSSLRGIVVAVPATIKEITTKKTKQRMAYVMLEDKTGSMQVVVLPHIHKQFADQLSVGTPAKFVLSIELIEGEDGASIVRGKVESIAEVQLKDEGNGLLTVAVPMEKALDWASWTRSNAGNHSQVSVVLRSTTGMLIEAGEFRYKFPGTKLLQKMEEIFDARVDN
jgi:DNA polymerase III subunit alpha